jgi:type 1 glutamine amidotransferase
MILAVALVATSSVANAQKPSKSNKPATKQAAKKAPTPEELAKKAAEQQKRLAEELPKVAAVMPDKAPAKPKKPRKVLIYTACKGFVHDSIPLAAKTLELMGKKTGAFEATITDDPQMFAPEKLNAFDAVVMDNCTGDTLPSPELKKSLLAFVESGKGIIGIHAACDAFYQWPEYGKMMGGYFAGHPFGQITVKLDDAKNPINAAFQGKGFDIADEIYTFREPYSRETSHILLSVDWAKSPKAQDAAKKAIESKHWKGRADNDYALSWIRQQGQGRVFYCAFGHQHQIFWNPTILQHYLAGIQYALGDLTIK